MKLNPPLSRQRSRRQRKKLRIAEFRELAFEVSMRWDHEPDAAEQDAFLDALLSRLIEARGLLYGGGVDVGYVLKNGRGSASEEDRAVVKAWLEAWPGITAATAGPLEDAWHDSPQYAL